MIHSPVLIVGCPRSGTTLLFHLLSEVPELWSIGAEGGDIVERWHHPCEKNWESGALVAADLTPESRAGVVRAFEQQAAPGSFWRRVNRLRVVLRRRSIWRQVKGRGANRRLTGVLSAALPRQGMRLAQGIAWLGNRIPPRTRDGSIRLLEKTPENCLRLPFMMALFPDARIIYMIRDGRDNVSSLMEGWGHPYLFHRYRPPLALRIPGNGQPDTWAFTLIPGWRNLAEASLEEVCAWQWIRCNEAVLTHRRETVGKVKYLTLRYEDLVGNTCDSLQQVARFIGVDLSSIIARYGRGLPEVNVLTPPRREKWRGQNPEAIARIGPLIRPLMDRLAYPIR